MLSELGLTNSQSQVHYQLLPEQLQKLSVDKKSFKNNPTVMAKLTEGKENLKEALEVYYEGEQEVDYHSIEKVETGAIEVNI